MAETVAIQGSTTFSSLLLEPHRTTIEQRSGHRLDFIANKSLYGLVALLEGRIEMAMISSALDGERELLRSRWGDLPIDRLQVHEISRTRVAFIAHPSNPVSQLPLTSLAKVLSGEIANWRQLGGTDLPIAVVSVQPGGGVPTTVRSQLLDGRRMTPQKMIVVEAPRHVVMVTAQHPGALGIAQVGLVATAPVHEVVTDAKVEQQLNFVTLGEPSPRLRQVIETVRQIAAEKFD